MEHDERRKYENDVYYEVWRSGRDPDRIDFDRVDTMWYDGLDADGAAASECRRMRQADERRYAEEQQFEQEW